MDTRVAAYAVIERRGEVLLTHWRRNHLHGWTLPGGGVEAGEDPRDTVVREVFEETGLTARCGRLIGVDSRVMVREEVPEGVDPQLHTIRIVYRATVTDGPLINEVDGSSDEARWVPLRELGNYRTLSLVNTGLRMAGIQHGAGGRKSGGRGSRSARGGSRSGTGRSAGTKGGAQPSERAQPGVEDTGSTAAGSAVNNTERGSTPSGSQQDAAKRRRRRRRGSGRSGSPRSTSS